MEQRLLKLIIVAVGLLTIFVIALSILFALSIQQVKDSIRAANRDSDIVKAIRSLKVVNGQNGAQGIPGANGLNGQNATSTLVIQQQPIQGPKGDKGDPGNSVGQVQFDGNGNYRYAGDDTWQPLFQESQ